MVQKKKGHEESAGSLGQLYPAYPLVNAWEARMVDLPGSGASYFHPGAAWGGSGAPQFTLGDVDLSAEESSLQHRLPADRVAKYQILEAMAESEVIDSAIKMHIGHALSCKSDSGEAILVEQVDDGKQDPIVADLKATLERLFNNELNEWAYKAAVFGTHFVRVYGRQGKGLLNIRSDYYTHARHIKKFEKAGQLAGFTTAYQGTSPTADKQIRLMPPWAFVEFQIPTWRDVDGIEPRNIGGVPVDLSIEEYETESVIESQSYGSSLIETAYAPWLDLLEAICSVNMSRKNAARLERLVGVNTGKLDPEKAARYTNMIASQMLNTDREMARQSWLKGYVQTVINRIVPVFGEKGRLDINTVQGTPDITGLEDVNFHIKRLGAALGVDPSMLGFGDFLSGGLGDGGFMRVSIMAGMKAQALRRAIASGVQRLCELHVAYKYGKVFLPGEYPWKITFNSLSTAVEREEQEALEARAGIAGTLAGIIATLDQDFAVTDKRALMHFFWGLLKKDDATFEQIFPAGKKPEQLAEDFE